MALSRRNTNGRSPLVNEQRQITSFFSKSNIKQNPNPSPTTPSPSNTKPHKPLLLIGASPSPSPPSTSHYGDDVVGRRIKVYWPLDKAWYEGSVKSFDKLASKHLVEYDDGEHESLDLSKEKIEWPHQSSTKKLKRLRKMVIEDNDEVEDTCHDDDDDSSDEDWGKNAVVEGDGEEEGDMELEEEEEEEDDNDDDDDVKKRSRKMSSGGKVEPRKRKLNGTEKFEAAKKSKSGEEVQVGKGGFKLSVLEPTNNTSLERK